MKSQIFVKNINLKMLTDFLDVIKEKNKNKYLISPIIYRQAQYNDKVAPFFTEIDEYYHSSKKKYLENINYKKFLTVIRQLCRSLNVYYKSEIKYSRSNYEIVYYIYICND